MKSIRDILSQNKSIHFKYIEEEKKIISPDKKESPSQIRELVNIVKDLEDNNIKHIIIDMNEIIME